MGHDARSGPAELLHGDDHSEVVAALAVIGQAHHPAGLVLVLISDVIVGGIVYGSAHG
jgi:hypothetical protein